MARDLNKVTLTGRLGKDVDFKITPSGTSVATFSVASNRPVKQSDGNWSDQTEWFRVVAWDKLAERCNTQLMKGRHVLIEGRLQTREWEDKQTGQKRQTTEVIATDMLTLDPKREGQNGQTEAHAFEEDLEPEGIPF